ncbi:MAG: hypothetical protein ACXVVK_23080 [Solirubrobacteraceae bacterium]
MLLTIIAIWAIVIPLVVLAISWEAANRREARTAQGSGRTGAKRLPAGMPRCTRRALRPRRTITRRVCPQHSRARRRPASA